MKYFVGEFIVKMNLPSFVDSSSTMDSEPRVKRAKKSDKAKEKRDRNGLYSTKWIRLYETKPKHKSRDHIKLVKQVLCF